MTAALPSDLAPPGASVSVLAVDGDGNVLAQRDPDRLVAPASNVKLLTAAVAFATLSPEYRMETAVQAAGRTVNRHLYGDVRLVAGGAPDFDRADLEALAADVGDRVDTVTGDLVLDTSLFEGVQYSRGRAWEDAQYAYGAPTTALSLGKNVVSVSVTVSRDGDASVEVDPPSPVVVPDVDVTATGERDRGDATDSEAASSNRDDAVTARADPCGGVVRIDGDLSPGESFETPVPVRRPLEQSGQVARDAFAAAGVEIHGDLVIDAARNSSRRHGDSAELASVSSAPLAELCREMNVESDNVVADTLARSVAARATDAGSWSAWADQVSAWLEGLGAESGRVVDGSGLSRYNRVSARTVVAVLRQAADSEWGDQFYDSLPGPGEGTLADRLHGVPVRAKTGTLTDARALSGRVERDGAPVYFSLLVDGITDDDAPVRARQDDVVRELAGL